MWIHALIAVLSTIILGLQGYKSFSEIPAILLFCMILNALVQGLNAVKAFSDTSSGRDAIVKEEAQKLQVQKDTENVIVQKDNGTKTVSLSN